MINQRVSWILNSFLFSFNLLNVRSFDNILIGIVNSINLNSLFIFNKPYLCVADVLKTSNKLEINVFEMINQH